MACLNETRILMCHFLPSKIFQPLRFLMVWLLCWIVKGSWQQEHPRLWNTLEVNNKALISPITSIRGGAQYQAALLGTWENLVVKRMCLPSAWKMQYWKDGYDGLEVGHFRIRKKQEWET